MKNFNIQFALSLWQKWEIRKKISFLLSWRAVFIVFLLLLSLSANFAFVQPYKTKQWLIRLSNVPSTAFPALKKSWLNRVFKSAKRTSKVELASKEGLLFDSMEVRVVKTKYNGKIYLEFLSKKEDGSYSYINRVQLKGVRNGYFEFWEQPASLYFLDNDGDGILDIIAPTVDKFFRPHINIVVYNHDTRQFELIESKKGLTDYPEIVERKY